MQIAPLSTTDFYTSYVATHPVPIQGKNYQQTISLLQTNTPKAATIYKGTFNLTKKIQTWQSHAAELHRACATKHRIKRAVVTLVGVAVVTAAVAAMVFGGDIAWLVGAAGLFLFACITKKTVEKELLKDTDNNHDNSLLYFFHAVPFLFLLVMATYESRRVKKLAHSKQKAIAIANYVRATHEEIHSWLERQKKEISEKLSRKKERLNLIDLQADRITLNIMQACLDDLIEIEGWTKNLDESLVACQTMPAENLASNS